MRQIKSVILLIACLITEMSSYSAGTGIPQPYMYCSYYTEVTSSCRISNSECVGNCTYYDFGVATLCGQCMPSFFGTCFQYNNSWMQGVILMRSQCDFFQEAETWVCRCDGNKWQVVGPTSIFCNCDLLL